MSEAGRSALKVSEQDFAAALGIPAHWRIRGIESSLIDGHILIHVEGEGLPLAAPVAQVKNARVVQVPAIAIQWQEGW